MKSMKSGLRCGVLGIGVALIGAANASASVGTFTLMQTDESLAVGNSWAVGVYNDNNSAADANKASSSGADIRDLGTDGITDASETTRKRITVMNWDLGSLVGPGEWISSITLSASNGGTNTGAMLDFYAANDGGAADLQAETLLETAITAMNWAGYNYAGPTTTGGFDSTIPLDSAQFSLIGSLPGANSSTAGVIYTQVLTDGDLLTAANADTNGKLMIAVLPTSDKGITFRRGNVSSAMRLDVTVVPEPASLALLGMGGLAVLGRRRK